MEQETYEYTRHELHALADQVAVSVNVKPKHAHEAVARVVAGISWKNLKSRMNGMSKIAYPGNAMALKARIAKQLQATTGGGK